MWYAKCPLVDILMIYYYNLKFISTLIWMFYRKIHTNNDTWKEASEFTYVYTLSYRIIIGISNIGDPGMPTIFGHFFFTN